MTYSLLMWHKACGSKTKQKCTGGPFNMSKRAFPQFGFELLRPTQQTAAVPAEQHRWD